MSTQRIVIGITGASGAVYARRMIHALSKAHWHTHLVVSPLGQRLLHDELGMEGIDLGALLGKDAPEPDLPITLHHFRDVGAAIASGSFQHEGMVICPCSSNTLSAVANGSQQNLLHRAAHVCLKERRRLVLLHREMPLSVVDIRNMLAATEAGAILCPASPYPALPHGTWLEEFGKGAFTYTAAYNLAGWPGAVVRGGTSPEGLPIGVQIVTRPWREDVALAVAGYLEGALGGWQKPPI